MNRTVKYSLLLLLTAAIWGFAFVAQSTGGDSVGPFGFNAIRNYIGAAVLIPVIRLWDRLGRGKKPVDKKEKKDLWWSGAILGLVLALASNLQQLGITVGRSAGKAGFLTANYLILVPVLGFFLGKKIRLHIGVAVIMAMVAIYFISMTESLSLALPDVWLLLSALCFAVQITLIDSYVTRLDPVRLAAVQFLFCAIFTTIPMVITEVGFTAASVRSWMAFVYDPTAWVSILYAGVLSSGVAYTGQMLGQSAVEPTLASLLMSFESVFCVIGGYLILGERMTGRQIAGCAIMFAAILLAQCGEALVEKKAQAPSEAGGEDSV